MCLLTVSSIFDSLASLGFDQVLGHTLVIQSEFEQNLVVSSCTNGHFPWVFHLPIEELGPILYRNPECHLLVQRQVSKSE